MARLADINANIQNDPSMKDNSLVDLKTIKNNAAISSIQ